MHIVFISAPYPPYARGGVGIYVHTMAHALSAAGHSCTVIARCPLGEDHDTRDGPIHVHWVGPFVVRALWRRPLRWMRLYESFPAVFDWVGWSVAAALKVRRLHAAEPVDVMEAPDHLAQGYASSFLHIPLIVRIHSPLAVNLPAKGQRPVKDHWLGFRFERWTVTRANMVTAPSQAYADFIRAFWRLGTKPIQIVPYPVDEMRFTPGGPGSRNLELVSYIGRLNQAKGIRVFLDSVPLVLESVPGARFRVVGPDEGDAPLGCTTYEEYMHRAHGAQLAERVEFLGWVPHETLPKHYQESLIIVFPSVGLENFPNAILETMSCGSAVIASRTGGTPSLVSPDLTGILVSPGDTQALASAIVELLSQPDRALSMGAAARRVVEERYARAVVAQQALPIYETTADSPY